MERWESILESTNSFPSVRQLTLEGEIPIPELDTGEFEPLEENPNLGESVEDLTYMHDYTHSLTNNNGIEEKPW